MTTEDRISADNFPDHMGASDAVLWDIEKDPVLRSTITAIAILDRAPRVGPAGRTRSTTRRASSPG